MLEKYHDEKKGNDIKITNLSRLASPWPSCPRLPVIIIHVVKNTPFKSFFKLYTFFYELLLLGRH